MFAKYRRKQQISLKMVVIPLNQNFRQRSDAYETMIMDQLSELSIFNFEYHTAVALFSATCPRGVFWGCELFGLGRGS